VDTGNFLSDEKSSHGMMAGYAITKNDWVLKALDRFRVDVINLSEQDLAFLRRQMGQDPQRATLAPLLGRMVSASAAQGSGKEKAIRPYVVIALPNRNSPGGPPIRVAFLGFSDDQMQPAGPQRLQDPVETARRLAAKAKAESDLVIVLANASSETADRIAREAADVDAVIAGNGKEFTMPATIGRVAVVFTPYETRMLGELRFYRNPEGGFAIKNRFIGLDTTIPDDQPATAFVAEAREAVKKTVEKFTKPMETRLPEGSGKAAGPVDSGFVSAQTCLGCHRSEYMTWSNTAHARAINSLATRAAELDSGCLACHTTGFNRGGFQNINETRTLVNVQCEECHGPGKAHITKPDKSYGHVADVQAVCARCHTTQTSADFKLDSFWAKIKH